MNKIPIRKFAFRLIVFSVVMAAAGVLFQWILPKYASPAIPFIVIFFFLLTLFTLYVVLRTEHKSSGKKFIAGYMVSRIVKMLSILTFVLLYLFLIKEGRMNFAGAFLIIYFSYSIFEIVALKKE